MYATLPAKSTLYFKVIKILWCSQVLRVLDLVSEELWVLVMNGYKIRIFY